jgi:hypothetical protein
MGLSFGAGLAGITDATSWRLSHEVAGDAEHVYLQEAFVRRVLTIS